MVRGGNGLFDVVMFELITVYVFSRLALASPSLMFVPADDQPEGGVRALAGRRGGVGVHVGWEMSSRVLLSYPNYVCKTLSY